MQKMPLTYNSNSEGVVKDQLSAGAFAKYSLSQNSLTFLQPKLTVGAPDDIYEREVDAMADKVMRMPEQNFIRRKCAACEEEEKKQLHRKPLSETATSFIQTKTESNTPVVSDSLSHTIESSKGSGSVMDSATNSFMSKRFGSDFSNVKIHTGGEAIQMNRELNAKAFTAGNDIYFNEGQYQPHSDSGKHLLAHELTHTIQQTGLSNQTVQRWAIESCNTAQQEYINDAITRAYSDITSVLPLLAARPLPENIRNALWLAFRVDTEDVAISVRSNLQQIRDNMINGQYICKQQGTGDHTQHCTGSIYGYTQHTGEGRTKTPLNPINLCMPAFSDLSFNIQGGAIIHEAAHRYLNIDDTGYFITNSCEETAHPRFPFAQNKDSGTAGDNPAYRLNNADAYRCFVHYLRYTSAAQLTTRSSDYRGNNISIASEDLTFSIYTNATTPRLHFFSAAGVPSNSGFRFRWKLRAGTTEYNPSSGTHGENAGAFSEENREVYFTNELTSLLWRNGVRTATLICETELYGPYGDRYAPPVITRSAEVTIVNGSPPADF